MVLKRPFEAFRRALKGDTLERVKPLRVMRKDGVHTLRAKQRMHRPGKAYIFHPGAVGVETTRSTSKRVQGWSVNLGQFRCTVRNTAGDMNRWEDICSRWVSEPLCVSEHSHAVMTAADLFDGQMGDLPTKG